MSKNIKIIVSVVVIVSLSIFLFRNDNPNSKVKVGVIVPLSGPIAGFGEEIKQGALIASSTNLELIFEDELCSVKEAVSALNLLILRSLLREFP